MRVRIHKLVEKNGGLYSKGFDASITHLVCGQSNVSDKVTAARQYNQTRPKESHVRIVWDEWFWDCVEFNGASSLVIGCSDIPST
jgi:DNA replication regulator DPB11